MKAKTLWSIIIALVLINCLTVVFFLMNDRAHPSSAEVIENGETIATIGDKEINRQDWLAELENRYGKQTLEEMIDIKVVEELASEYGIKVSDEAIERELTMYKSLYNPSDNQSVNDEEKWREQIRYSILLEELLTRDVTIPEQELEQFYESNQSLYEVADSYRISHIVVKTEEEALDVLKELQEGSSFNALAIERSIDDFTANEGGQLGFISETNNFFSPEYLKVAKKLAVDEWSEEPIKIDTGYAIIILHEELEGMTFSYDEVKDQIERLIALEQMEGNVRVRPLWKEVGVNWFYGEDGEG